MQCWIWLQIDVPRLVCFAIYVRLIHNIHSGSKQSSPSTSLRITCICIGNSPKLCCPIHISLSKSISPSSQIRISTPVSTRNSSILFHLSSYVPLCVFHSLVLSSAILTVVPSTRASPPTKKSQKNKVGFYGNTTEITLSYFYSVLAMNCSLCRFIYFRFLRHRIRLLDSVFP